MKRWMEWFQNHSLRFKMVLLLFAVVVVLQLFNGLVFTSIVSNKFEENISESNLKTVQQMAINLNQAMEDIVDEMVPIRDEVLSRQILNDGEEDSNDYISQYIVYQGMFNQLIAADNNYQFINSMLILNGRPELYLCTGRVSQAQRGAPFRENSKRQQDDKAMSVGSACSGQLLFFQR